MVEIYVVLHLQNVSNFDHWMHHTTAVHQSRSTPVGVESLNQTAVFAMVYPALRGTRRRL